MDFNAVPLVENNICRGVWMRIAMIIDDDGLLIPGATCNIGDTY